MSRRSETKPEESLVEWMILRFAVSMRLMKPLEVPAIMNVPSGEKIVAVVCCLSVDGDRSRGVVGRRCLIGFGCVVSTRYGWSSNKETTNRV